MLPPCLFDLGAHLSAHLSCLGIIFFSGKGGGGLTSNAWLLMGANTRPTRLSQKKNLLSFPPPFSFPSFQASGPPSFITSVRPKNKPTDGYETTYREKAGGQEDRKERDGDGEGMGKLSPPTLRMELIQRAFESPTLAHPQRSHSSSQFRN